MLKIPEKDLFILLNAINAQALVERCDRIVDFEKDEELVQKTKEYQEFLIGKMNLDVSHPGLLAFFEDAYKKADFFMAIALMAGKLSESTAKKINEKIQWALWHHGKIDIEKIENVLK